MLTPRVLGCFVVLVCQYLCRMQKALKHEKHVLSPSSSSQNTGLTIDNLLLDLLRSSSFVPSWHRAAQLSYSPAQTRGCKIMDDDDISIYTPKELERLESLRVQEFNHTRVYDVNLLKKGEMDVDLPTLFCAIGWRFVMRFLGSPLLVEGIQWIGHVIEG
jgi:hypothetical protein